MLTRLKVTGFKNLVDVDVRFGPFTCVAGANGVGKSNLFDAIKFLSALANDTFINAALSVRDEGGKTIDIRSLFHRIGDKYDKQISFEAEMIIPAEGIDDLGQQAKASITFVRYSIVLAYRVDNKLPAMGSFELIEENLDYIKLGDAPKYLKFPHEPSTWRMSVLKGKRTTSFISTENQEGRRIIKLSQDSGTAGRSRGRAKQFLASNLPRTVLSSVNALESPTALLARQEMLSWRLLQLEPSALREPDDFSTTPGLGIDGSHLAATLYYLARTHQPNDQLSHDSQIYEQVASRLSELIEGVNTIRIDRNERRELLTLEVQDHNGTILPARSLSDGTLRFLALAVLELDPDAKGLICLEEPENGIHPERIPIMLQLLQDIAVDVDEEIGPDNPLRQVIINTHSPAVVQLVPDDTLLVAELKEIKRNDQILNGACFSWLPDTWRATAEPEKYPVAKGKLLAYLDPINIVKEPDPIDNSIPKKKKTRRTIDRPDFQILLPFLKESE
ncbi:AAA family ATPase [candidate division KSB1 bacterium]|nr:AAA family ATPase [candidate division KSB1 bacterium]